MLSFTQGLRPVTIIERKINITECLMIIIFTAVVAAVKVCIYIYYSAHSPRGFSVADYIKYLSYLLFLTIYIYSFPHYFPNY